MPAWCFLIGLLPVWGMAQPIQGRVLDGRTRQPVVYAHVGIVGKNVGTITNEQGLFSLSAKNIRKGDTLRVTMLGYKSLDYLVPATVSKISQLNLEMHPVAYDLPTVTFFPKGKQQPLGATEDDLLFDVWGAGGLANGEELGRVFRVPPGQTVRIDTCYLHLRRNNPDSLLFRLNLYQLEEGKPGRPLLDHDVRFRVRPGYNEAEDGWVTIPLVAEQLILDKDFVLTIELLRSWAGFGFQPIFVSLAEGEEPALIRQSSQAPWIEHGDQPFAFRLLLSY
jgi:hypothetical protein